MAGRLFLLDRMVGISFRALWRRKPLKNLIIRQRTNLAAGDNKPIEPVFRGSNPYLCNSVILHVTAMDPNVLNPYVKLDPAVALAASVALTAASMAMAVLISRSFFKSYSFSAFPGLAIRGDCRRGPYSSPRRSRSSSQVFSIVVTQCCTPRSFGSTWRSNLKGLR